MNTPNEILAQEVTLVAGAQGPLAGEGDFEAMLTVALDGIIELSGAERGLVLLFDEDGQLLVEKGRGYGCLDVLEHIKSRRLDAWMNVWTGSWTDRRRENPPHGDNIKHLLVASVPSHDKDRFCGLVYLDHSSASLPAETLLLAQGLAQLVSVAALRGAEHLWRWRCVDAVRWNVN